MTDHEHPDHVVANRAFWTSEAAACVEPGRRASADPEPASSSRSSRRARRRGDTIRLLRASGFDVENLVELRASEGATTRYPYVTPEWARRWPSEEVWIARKRA